MAEGKQGMQDAWRAYLELALGVSEASKKKAQKVARQLVGKGGATAAQLQGLAEELMATSVTNRSALNRLIRSEVERALGAVGLASAEEVGDLRKRVAALEERLRQADRAPAPEQAPEQVGQAGPQPPRRPVAKKTVAPRAPRTAAATSAASTAADTADQAGPGGAAKKAAARKTVAKKTVEKKAVAKKSVAKKAAPQEDAGTGPAGSDAP